MSQENQAIYKRSARNFLLQPSLQLKLGVVTVMVAAFFCILIGGLTYVSLSGFYSMVLDLTDLREEVIQILDQYVNSMVWWLCGLIFLYLCVNVFLSIYYTHRLVGPTIAFRRHINKLMEDDYSSRVRLRKDDAFGEVAEVLNKLAVKLEENSKPNDKTGQA